VFGKNKQLKHIAHKPEHLLVKEIFVTLQGEGPFAGRPCTFVRLAGCNLKCHFCDTDFDADNAHERTVASIVEICRGNGQKLVVLTGGEPMLQNVVPLIEGLREVGISVQIETAGTVWPVELTEDHLVGKLGTCITTIVVSPKTPKLHPEVLIHATAFKYLVRSTCEFTEAGVPIFNTQSAEKAAPLAAPPIWMHPTSVFMQPVNEYLRPDYTDAIATEANVAKATELCFKHGFTLSLQLHKILGLP
jgi:organic radical activating enzyme